MKNLIEVEVKNVVLLQSEEGMAIAVVLKEKSGSRLLPIIIGPFEAKAISMALNGETFSRPLTHDLMHEILSVLGVKVDKVIINDLVDGTYYARIILSHDGKTYSIDSRPSDAIALALRAGAPIFVSSSVMDTASEYFPDFEGDEPEWEGGGDLGG
ncbi:MAG: bifunctional nuclease family protein [Thermotogae bacterium]|nr:bifunctional nuclease family protein [Thermotogota bacterium]